MDSAYVAAIEKISGAKSKIGVVELGRGILAKHRKEAKANRARRGRVRAAKDAIGLARGRYRARTAPGATRTNPAACRHY